MKRSERFYLIGNFILLCMICASLWWQMYKELILIMLLYLSIASYKIGDEEKENINHEKEM